MINNRQAGRRRGRGGGAGNNAPRQGGGGRSDNGNRIDSRARGNASQLYEKYKNMAADAQRQGDRVNTEYYLQFADHYFRVISDQRGRFDDQQPRRQQQEFDGDEDYGDEGEPIRTGEQAGEIRAERPERFERQDRQDQRQPRRAEGDRQPRRWDRDLPRADEEGASEQEVAGQRRADRIEPGEDLGARAEAVLEADAPLPRRRGRPRQDAAPVEAAAGGEASNGVDADRLPPSLGFAANDSDGDEPRPRRRRARIAPTDSAVE